MLPTTISEPPQEDTKKTALPSARDRARAEAWGERIVAHDHRLIVSLLAIGIRIERAKEIAQSAWLRLIEKDERGELDHIELPGLVIAQARFIALDDLKRERTERKLIEPLGDDTDEVTALDLAPSVEKRLVVREDCERALEVLAACSETAQRVFRLVYEEPSRPHTEIAKEVGLSLQRVRQILCEVRKKLRRVLDGKDGGAR